MATQYSIQRLAVDSSSFTNVVAPFDCSTLIISNAAAGVALTIRSDPDDSDTEKTLPADAEGEIRASLTCFAKDSVVCAIKAASGTGPAVVSFAR